MTLAQMNALLSIGLTCALALSARADEKKFEAIALDYAGLADLVAKLDKLILEDVRIVDVPIGEAVSELQKLGVKGSKASGVINFVVRPLEDPKDDPPGEGGKDDPFAGGEESQIYYPETVSLTSASISFAAAVDEICKRAGYIWSVDISKPTMPYLILRPNPNGQQGVAPQSATRPGSNSEGGDQPQPESKPHPR